FAPRPGPPPLDRLRPRRRVLGGSAGCPPQREACRARAAPRRPARGGRGALARGDGGRAALRDALGRPARASLRRRRRHRAAPPGGPLPGLRLRRGRYLRAALLRSVALL